MASPAIRQIRQFSSRVRASYFEAPRHGTLVIADQTNLARDLVRRLAVKNPRQGIALLDNYRPSETAQHTKVIAAETGADVRTFRCDLDDERHASRFAEQIHHIFGPPLTVIDLRAVDYTSIRRQHVKGTVSATAIPQDLHPNLHGRLAALGAEHVFFRSLIFVWLALGEPRLERFPRDGHLHTTFDAPLAKGGGLDVRTLSEKRKKEELDQMIAGVVKATPSPSWLDFIDEVVSTKLRILRGSAVFIPHGTLRDAKPTIVEV